MRALVVLNGALDQALLRHELAAAELVVAADGGAAAVNRSGGVCSAIVGDLDSLASDDLAEARRRSAGVDVRTYPRAKDATDAELALAATFELGAEAVRVIGGFGGDRLDHALANVALLAHPAWRDRDVVLIDSRRTVRLVTRDHAWTGTAGDIVTLVPVQGDATGVTTTGLAYPLQADRLPFGTSLGVSNEMTGEQASVSLAAGAVLLVHERGRSDHADG